MDRRSPLPITYWTDPLCVWAFVSQAKHERLLADYAGRIEITSRIVPVFASIPHRFREGSWAEAGVAGRVEKTRATAEAFAIEGVDGRLWEIDPPASSWAVGLAVVAARLGARAGRLPADAELRYHVALRNTAFHDNRNTARRSVQLEVAESLGLDRGVIEAALDDGSAMAELLEDHCRREHEQVKGSPTYVFDEGREMLYGNVPEAVIRATIDALLEGVMPGGSTCE
jgi:predicted DsbA family dithiol-disulfide isomerase